jgi:hypothetical protein
VVIGLVSDGFIEDLVPCNLKTHEILNHLMLHKAWKLFKSFQKLCCAKKVLAGNDGKSENMLLLEMISYSE